MTQKRIPLSRAATSQKAVFQYLKENPGLSAQEIGDALWSPCNAHAITKRKPELVRREWAGKILITLKKKGLAKFTHKNHPRWSVIPAVPEIRRQDPPYTDDICEWCGQRYPVAAKERFYMVEVFGDVHVICGDCYDNLKEIRRV